MMTVEQITTAKERLENAFRPLICKVEDLDYRSKIRFKVLDGKGNTVFEVPQVFQSTIIDERHFADVIEQARRVIQAKGYILK